MKEFLVGLIFLLAVFILGGVGFLLFPFWIVLALFLRLVLGLIFVILAIWLLGKFIIYIWSKIIKL